MDQDIKIRDWNSRGEEVSEKELGLNIIMIIETSVTSKTAATKRVAFLRRNGKEEDKLHNINDLIH